MKPRLVPFYSLWADTGVGLLLISFGLTLQLNINKVKTMCTLFFPFSFREHVENSWKVILKLPLVETGRIYGSNCYYFVKNGELLKDYKEGSTMIGLWFRALAALGSETGDRRPGGAEKGTGYSCMSMVVSVAQDK